MPMQCINSLLMIINVKISTYPTNNVNSLHSIHVDEEKGRRENQISMVRRILSL